MRSKKKYLISFLFISLLMGSFLFFSFSGFLVGLHELSSYGFFRRVELNLFGQHFEHINEPKEPGYYDSIFLRLYSTETDISNRMLRAGNGGGMTSFGDAVLLLTHDGQIFNVQSADKVNETSIAVPNSGYMAYKHISVSKEFEDFTHALGFFRYNDLLFYESEKNRGLAISYTEFDSTNICYHNTVAILPIETSINLISQLSAEAEDWQIIYRSQPCLPLKLNHTAIDGGVAGGRMDFRAPSTILLGNGDYHWDGMFGPEALAQNLKSEYGKIMSIDLKTRESRIIASGIRNPQGIALDGNGTLWMVEHGFRGGDELNRIEEGNNYGWPIETLGTQYSKLPFPNMTEEAYGHHDVYTEPTYAWLPSIAISNLTLIKNFHPSWDGDLLMGTLKDRSLHHIRIKDNRVVFSERVEIGERIRYVHQHTDGRIILWTDSKKLIFLTGQPFTNNFVTDYLSNNITNEAWREKVRIAIDSCRQCHSIEPNIHTNAPSLAGIFKSEIASSDYEDYSTSLSTKQGVWTAENLKVFLLNPDQFAPGTVMPDPGINDEDMLDEIIKFLQTLNNRLPF